MYYTDWESENFPLDSEGQICVVNFDQAGVAPRDVVAMVLYEPELYSLALLLRDIVPWLKNPNQPNFHALKICRYMFGVSA